MKGQLFVHVGLPKTASTFLQWEVFPRIPDVLFLGKGRSIDFPSVYKSPASKVLISHEHLLANPFTLYEGGWLGEFRMNASRLARRFPGARILLSFREHENLLTSYYAEYISKPGRPFLSPDEFFDPIGDLGLLRWRDLEYVRIIQCVEEAFGTRPFLFLFEDVVRDLGTFLHDLGQFLGARLPEADQFRRDRVNPSVGHHQARLLVWLNRLDSVLRRIPYVPGLYNPLFRRLSIDPDRLCRKHLAFLSNRPLILPEAHRSFLREYYADDWREVVERTRRDRERRAGERPSRSPTW